MNRFVKFSLVAIAIIGMMTTSVSATDLAIFRTSNIVPGNSAILDAAEVVDASVSVSDLALNFPNVSPSGSAWDGALSVQEVFAVPNLNESINGDGVFDGAGTDGGDYVTVTVTPNSPINFTEFQIRTATNVAGVGGNPQNVDLLSSLTGFTAADSLGTFHPTGGNFSELLPAIDLSGVAALQNVAVPVEFRLYVSNIGNRLSIGGVFNGGAVTDDVIIRGSVVPEPSTLLLLAAATIAGCSMRKRR